MKHPAIGSLPPPKKNLRKTLVLLLIGLLGSLSLAACAGGSEAAKPEITLNLVSFSITKPVYDEILPKFADRWQKEHNQRVNFQTSYGGSVAQAEAVIAGKQAADVVHLSLPLDVIRIEEAGLITPGWQERVPRRGIVTHSVAAIVTRKGNPKKIAGWPDLAREDVKVLAADPSTSGMGIWQFLALWGSVTQRGGLPEGAREFVSRIYERIPDLSEDARTATDSFFREGKGDVLITYENEILLAKRNRPDVDYFIPEFNISIDNPVAVVDKNVDRDGTREVAEAFVDYLYSEEAQREFALAGYRSVNPFVALADGYQFPPVRTLFNAQDMGGWSLISKEFFAPGAVFQQIRDKRAVGGVTR